MTLMVIGATIVTCWFAYRYGYWKGRLDEYRSIPKRSGTWLLYDSRDGWRLVQK
jgi:hypothetical protein